MKAVIYARYSSDTQREESIEGQIRECTEYAKYNDMEIVGQYIDRAFSAKTDDRPDFQRMIADSAKKLFDVVLVWKLDRFARNRYDSAFYRYTLRKNGVRVVSAKENISNGPEGIILESLLEGIAEFYSANLSQNVKRGFKENALKGKWNGGAVPLGYRVVEHKLEVAEATAPVVQKMYTMCADGYTAKQIYDYLREKQVRRANGKPIAYNSVLYLLSNRIYLGEYRHSGIVLEHAFPALISDDYLLTTHLFCGHCGAMMTAYSGTSRTGKTYRYYICNRARKHLCDKEKAEKEKIEDFVVRKTMELLRSDEVIERFAELLYELQYEESTILPHLEEQCREREREIGNIVSAIQKGAASDTLIARLTELEQQKAALMETIAEESKKSPVFTKDEFKMALCNYRKIDVGKLEGRRKLIDTFVNSVFLYDDHLKIIYNGKEKEEVISLKELESSKLSQIGQPITDNIEQKQLDFVRFLLFSEWFLEYPVSLRWELGSKLGSFWEVNSGREDRVLRGVFRG